MENKPVTWRRRFTSCAVGVGMVLLVIVFLGFLLIPILFRSDRTNTILKKEEEDEQRRSIYGH